MGSKIVESFKAACFFQNNVLVFINQIWHFCAFYQHSISVVVIIIIILSIKVIVISFIIVNISLFIVDFTITFNNDKKPINICKIIPLKNLNLGLNLFNYNIRTKTLESL